MENDERCCGTGTCIIDNQGRCWCGQQWDGEKMCHPPAAGLTPAAAPAAAATTLSTPFGATVRQTDVASTARSKGTA